MEETQMDERVVGLFGGVNVWLDPYSPTNLLVA